MRIILAHNNYSITGGAEVFYHEVGRVLEENGHDVAYFSCADDSINTPWSKYFPETANYQSVGLFKKIKGFPSMVYSSKSKEAIKKLFEDFKPDIIHAFALHVKLTPSILDAARLANVPVVMSCNDYKHICPNYKLYHHGHVCEECKGGKFYRAVLNRCCHNSMAYSIASSVEAYAHNLMNIYRKNIHTFLFSSEFMAHKTEEFWGSNSFRWLKLRNPFDSKKFEATFSPNGSVLYFGRLIEEKGVDILIHAASRLPDVSFRIVGDGPDMQMLEQLAEKLELDNVEFLGAKWEEDMDAELQACRFVVVPSMWHENFPYVINQSFAFGKPVIGSNRGGIPELVQHGERGLIYEATAPESLASAIKELWVNSEKVETMGDSAKEFADREFNDEFFFKTLNDIYSKVLS